MSESKLLQIHVQFLPNFLCLTGTYLATLPLRLLITARVFLEIFHLPHASIITATSGYTPPREEKWF